MADVFRRLVTRYESKAENYLGLLHLAALVILLRRL
jgi:transposase